LIGGTASPSSKEIVGAIGVLLPPLLDLIAKGVDSFPCIVALALTNPGTGGTAVVVALPVVADRRLATPLAGRLCRRLASTVGSIALGKPGASKQPVLPLLERRGNGLVRRRLVTAELPSDPLVERLSSLIVVPTPLAIERFVSEGGPYGLQGPERLCNVFEEGRA
jgi:hypothetical protein